MPNYVHNKLQFASPDAEQILAAICPNDRMDFAQLVPPPPHVYYGDLGTKENEDFPLNWFEWRSANWNTKWNAAETTISQLGQAVVVQFTTAWRPPYPVMAAFANRFKIPFIHAHISEGRDSWAVETWGASPYDKDDLRICRIEKRVNDAADLGQFAGIFD